MPDTIDEPQQKVNWNEFEPVNDPAQAVDWSQFEEVKPPGFVSRVGAGVLGMGRDVGDTVSDIGRTLPAAAASAPGVVGRGFAAGVNKAVGGLLTGGANILAHDVHAPGYRNGEYMGDQVAEQDRKRQALIQRADVEASGLGTSGKYLSETGQQLSRPGFVSQTAEQAGAFLPAVLSGPAAPLEMGLQNYGETLDSQYQAYRQKGLSDQDALAKSISDGLNSGVTQAAIWTVLPGPLQRLVSKATGLVGEGAVKQFIAKRAGAATTGAVLGAASQTGQNITTGQPLTQGVGPAAAGLGLLGLVTPGEPEPRKPNPSEAAAMKLAQMVKEANLPRSFEAVREVEPQVREGVSRALPPGYSGRLPDNFVPPTMRGQPEPQGPKKNQPVVVPGTPAEPEAGMIHMIQEIRRANANTRAKVQALFPERGLKNQEAAALVRQAFNKPEPTKAGEPKTTAGGVIQHEGRDIVVVHLPDGRLQPFYRSTGKNSGMPGVWLPFDGVEPIGDTGRSWFNKARFLYPKDAALERFGHQDWKDVSDWLGKQDIKPGREVLKSHEVNDWLESERQNAQTTKTGEPNATQKGQVEGGLSGERPRDDTGGPSTEPGAGGGVPPKTPEPAPPAGAQGDVLLNDITKLRQGAPSEFADQTDAAGRAEAVGKRATTREHLQALQQGEAEATAQMKSETDMGAKLAAQKKKQFFTEAIRHATPRVAATETGFTLHPEIQYGDIKSEGLTPEMKAELEKEGLTRKWEFTDRRKGSPSEGITLYVDEGTHLDDMIKAIQDKEASATPKAEEPPPEEPGAAPVVKPKGPTTPPEDDIARIQQENARRAGIGPTGPEPVPNDLEMKLKRAKAKYQEARSLYGPRDIRVRLAKKEWDTAQAAVDKGTPAATPPAPTEPTKPSMPPAAPGQTRVLSGANIDTTADVAAASEATAPGERPKWTPKIAKEQKQALFDAIDEATQTAMDEQPQVPADADATAKAQAKVTVEGESAGDRTKRVVQALDALMAKYQIPTHSPGYTEIKTLDPKHKPKTVPPIEYSQATREELLDRAIAKAQFEQLPKVTIDIPGDGTFDIIDTKAALNKFKEEHAKKFPTTAPRPEPALKTPTPRATPTHPAPVGKLEKGNVLAALNKVRSTDESKYIINYLWSDGKRTVATNGRMLTVINHGIGGTEKEPGVFTIEGAKVPPPKLKNVTDKFPDWQRVVPKPDDMKGSVPNVDTAHLFGMLKEAEQMTTEKSNSVKIFVNQDGSLGVTADSPELGSYSNNVDPGTSKLIAAFNPEYLMDLLNAARRVGDHTVTLEYIDELGPLRIVGKNSMSVLMPMRLSFGGRRGGTFGGWPKHQVTGEAEPETVTNKGAETLAKPSSLGFGGTVGRNTRKLIAAVTPQQLQNVLASRTPGLGTRIVSGLKSLLMPSSKSAAHLREAERLGSMLGQMHRRQEATATQLRGASLAFDRLGVHDEKLAPEQNPGIQFMSAMSQGRALPPKLEAIANLIRKEFRDRLNKLRQAGAPLQTVRQNYFPGMWTRESREAFNLALDEAIKGGKLHSNIDVNNATPAQRAMIKARVDELLKAGQGSDRDMMAFFTRRPLKGRETFRKEKVFDDIMDAAEFGLRPISNNPIDLVKGKLAEMDKSIMANQEFQSLKADGKLKVVNPYEDMPENWVRLNDKYGTIYGPPTTPVSEHIDKAVYEGLVDFARSLGIEHKRTMKFPAGPGSRALGLSYQGGNLIRSRFGTETSVIAHELGHQLDHKYDLWQTIYKDATGVGKKGKVTKAASRAARVQIGKDLRAIADLTGSRGGDPRSQVEKIAQMVEAYVHAPDLMKEHAPLLYEHFDKFIQSKPELAPLAKIKPGIELEKLTSEKYVGLPIVGYRIVPKEVGDIVNNYLSSSLYNNQYFGPLYKGWMGSANALNQAQLGLGSAFHAGFTTLDAQISANADLLKDAYGLVRGNRTVKDVGRAAGRAATASVRTAMTGDKVLNAWRNPDGVIDPRIAQVVKAAELAGGGFKLEHGLQTEQVAKVYRDWFSDHQVRAALRTPVAATELLAKPIMNWLVPRQKAGVFAELVWRIIEQNPGKALEDLTPELRQAWNRVDARLGQVRYDRLFANNTAKSVIQGLVRAPGWSGGTIAEIGGAFPDAARFAAEWARTGKAPANIPDRVAYTLALLTTAGVANGVLTYALSGKQPTGMDYLAFWDGTLDEHGNKRRWLLPSYMKDILAYAIHPGQTMINKSHPLLSVLDDVLVKNKDYYGYEIRDPHAPLLTQAGQSGKYVLKSFVPFWIRGVQQASKQQAGVGQTAAPLVGVMPAPRYITMTPMQRQISDLYHQRTGEGTKPYSKQFTPQKKKDLLSSDIEQFKRLPDTDKAALRAKMTPEERARYH